MSTVAMLVDRRVSTMFLIISILVFYRIYRVTLSLSFTFVILFLNFHLCRISISPRNLLLFKFYIPFYSSTLLSSVHFFSSNDTNLTHWPIVKDLSRRIKDLQRKYLSLSSNIWDYVCWWKQTQNFIVNR